jgi:aminodeoxyfutalosine synthase
MPAALHSARDTSHSHLLSSHTHADPRLNSVRAKVLRGERLSLDDGDLLFTTPDIWTVCELADLVRRRLHGSSAYYNVNRHMNYSNVCALSCKFCEFYRKQGDDGAYTRDMAYVREQVRQAIDAGATEMHIVGGLHPYLPWSYYPELISTIRDEAEKCLSSSPNTLTSHPCPLHIKAFTAVEIVHLAKIAKKYSASDRTAGIRFVLSELKAAGLGSLPGGGAEVFDDRVHDEAFKGKIRSDVWLDVHRIAHELGLNTNATILYGHIEQRHDRLVHMDMLRRAQDRALARMGYEGIKGSSDQGNKQESTAESGHLGYTADEGADVPVITLTRPNTPLPEHIAFASASPSAQCLVPSASSGYFQTIIPLPFFPDGCELEHLPGPSGLENLRTLAVARLMLDNFPHVKAFWIMQTLPMSQLMLQAGADDIDGTIVWYDITKVGGASTHQEVSVPVLKKAIRDAGFIPVERDTLYRRIERDSTDGKRWTIAQPSA